MPFVIWPTAARVVQCARFLSRVSPWVVVQKSGYARRSVNGSQTKSVRAQQLVDPPTSRGPAERLASVSGRAGGRATGHGRYREMSNYNAVATSGTATAALRAPHVQRVVDAAQGAHSASTRRNYRAAWRRF